MEEQILDQSYNSASANDFNNSNMIDIRLSTRRLIEDIEMYLTGAEIIEVANEQGLIIKKKKFNGKPKANKEGLRSIMNIVQSLVNPSIVQGNMNTEDYYKHLNRVHINLAIELTSNITRWEIDETDIPSICNFIMNLFIPFLSRTINDGERNSYFNTLRTVQTIKDNTSKGGFFGEN